MIPNRPDALGVYPDAKTQQVLTGLSRSRYADGVLRVAQRLGQEKKTRNREGKSSKPQSRSKTLMIYLKALEGWACYSIALWGEEVDPRSVTTDMANAYALWLRGEGPGPDIRGMTVRALGPDFTGLYEAIVRSTQIYGQANIVQIVEAMEPALRERLVQVSSDPRQAPNFRKVHTMLGKMIRAFRNVQRMPTTAMVREAEGAIWTEKERDPLTFTYTVLPQSPLSPSTVSLKLGCLSAIWADITTSSPGAAPLSFNPWKSVYSQWHARDRQEKEAIRLRGEAPAITTALVRAVLKAARGADMESRRDTLLLKLLLLGLRSEEVAGLLRQDLVTTEGVWTLEVVGKGAIVRQIPLYSEVRDAIMMMNSVLEIDAAETYADDDGRPVPTYKAIYAQTLFTPEAPLVPSLYRWGCNTRDRNAATDAMEPLDVSGVRAIVARLADRARVRELSTNIIRPLSVCGPECKGKACRHEKRLVHPHAFRHYAAMSAYQAGVPILDIQQVLGHQDVRSTANLVKLGAQTTMAFSAAVTRSVFRDAPETPEDITEFRKKLENPLEDKNIVEADPADERQTAAASFGPGRPPDATRVIAGPMWAYEGVERIDANYFPKVKGRPANPKSFARDRAERMALASQAMTETKRIGDETAYAAALSAYTEASNRYLWNTFRIGNESRLPWWAGRHNRWKTGQMPPLLSSTQVAPEDSEETAIVKGLSALHDKLYAEQGPTAANALVTWLSEIVQMASTQFAKAMYERGDTWVLFDEEAVAGDTSVVREHAVEPVIAWFETFGWAFRATIAKSAKNRGNIAIAAMDELPDWFWLEDPLLELPGEERLLVQKWITGLQGRRKSRVRFDMWVDQFSARIGRWARSRRGYEDAKARKWKRGGADAGSVKLSAKLDAMEAEFARKFPTIRKTPDIATIAEQPEPKVRETLLSMLASQGIDPQNPSRSELGPAIEGRPGYLHPFDPGLLTFDLRSTIVHDEKTKQFWYERYGSDSECVTRRAIRALWERRKSGLLSQNPSLLLRHFDEELSTMIPCPKEMERRMAERGWQQPKSVEDMVSACRVMWQGFVDRMRGIENLPPQTKIPQDVIADFWVKEIAEFDAYVVGFTTGAPVVIETVSGDAVIDRIDADFALAPAPAQRARDAVEEDPDVEAAEVGWEPSVAAEASPMSPISRDPDSLRELEDRFGAREPDRTFAQSDVAKLRDAEKSLRAARKGMTRDADLERAAAAAISSMIAKSTQTRGGWTLDYDDFVTLSDTPRRFVFFGSEKAAAAFSPGRMRKTLAVIGRFKPALLWDPLSLRIIASWINASGRPDGVQLAGSLATEVDPGDTFHEIAFPSPDYEPNAAFWSDERPWLSRWPGYPYVDPSDKDDPFVMGLAWPSALVAGPREGYASCSCMRRYAGWKRNSQSPGGPGWIEGSQPQPAAGMLHPVELVFAALRPA